METCWKHNGVISGLSSIKSFSIKNPWSGFPRGNNMTNEEKNLHLKNVSSLLSREATGYTGHLGTLRHLRQYLMNWFRTGKRL